MGAFTDLLKEENLERIQIDEKLVPVFKNVMKKIQLFFDVNRYSELKVYNAFFLKNIYLLPPESDSVSYDVIGYTENKDYHKGFTIELNDERLKKNCLGFYNKKDERICIDNSINGNNEFWKVYCAMNLFILWSCMI